MAEPKENMPEEKKPEEDKETLGRLTPKKISDKGWQRGPLVEGPVAGGTTDITGSNDQHLAEVSQFASDHLAEENSGLHYVQMNAKVQVVAGLIYTLRYNGNDDDGVCQEERVIVVYDKPWTNERVIKSDHKAICT
ncbi:unnamed protein product [Ascophyllum nodosum]